MTLSPTRTITHRFLVGVSFLGVSLALGALGTGCRMMKSAADFPGQTVRTVTPGWKDKSAIDPAEVQQKLLRLADEFSAQMVGGIDKLRRGTNAISPAEALKWKIVIVTESCSIAAGPNALANLLDMTVFITAGRTSLEEYWQPNAFGASAQPMLEMARGCETNIWVLAGVLLSLDQQAELRRAIAVWRQQHPLPEHLHGARAAGFATEMAREQKAEASSGSVFGLLGIDPLSGLDPATREIALTRMFAERALFVTQWMPTLLRWQIELLSLNAMAMPELQQLITNSTQLTASVDRVARAAEQLPNQISTERQAIFAALEGNEKDLASLAAETRRTILAGSEMSASLNTTLTTFDALMKRFGVGEPKTTPVKTNSEPFRVLDYAQTAIRVEAMTKQLTELVRGVDQTMGSSNLARLSSEATPVIKSAQSAGKEVVDHIFQRAVGLIVIGCGCVLLTIWLSRIAGARRAKGEPKAK